MNKKIITIQDFLNKLEDNESKKVKVTHIEILEFGVVEFIRPREGVLLDYLDELVKAVNITKEKTFEEIEDSQENNENIKVMTEKENSKVDMRMLLKASEKLVYLCCPIMQKKEVRDRFKSITPHEIPTEIFGMNSVIDLAQKLNSTFEGIKTKESVEKAVKN